MKEEIKEALQMYEDYEIDEEQFISTIRSIIYLGKYL
jgi:hypothetical protein